MKHSKKSTDEIVALLVKVGAEVSSQNNKGFTPLHTATLALRPSTIIRLLKIQANFSIKGADETAHFHFAASASLESLYTII